jgi:hypothetical protein
VAPGGVARMRGTPPNLTDVIEIEIEIRPGGGPAVVPYREGPVDPLKGRDEGDG